MREIKFICKRIDNGEWIYGYLIHHNSIASKTSIVTESVKDYRDCFVVDYTVGQFTGLHDKDGKEIYEGDIIHLGDPTILYDVIWRDCGLMAMQEGTQSFIGLRFWSECITVVGNIHDNPELLKGGEE